MYMTQNAYIFYFKIYFALSMHLALSLRAPLHNLPSEAMNVTQTAPPRSGATLREHARRVVTKSHVTSHRYRSVNFPFPSSTSSCSAAPVGRFPSYAPTHAHCQLTSIRRRSSSAPSREPLKQIEGLFRTRSSCGLSCRCINIPCSWY